MADYKPKKFDGTAQTVLNSTSNVTAGNFSGTPTEYDNTSDASVPNAPFARAVIKIPSFSAEPPVPGAVLSLWMIQKNSNGALDDSNPPSGTTANGARFIGSFPPLAAVSTEQRRTLPAIDMRGVNAADFFFKNDSGVTCNGASNITLDIIPYTIGVTG